MKYTDLSNQSVNRVLSVDVSLQTKAGYTLPQYFNDDNNADKRRDCYQGVQAFIRNVYGQHTFYNTAIPNYGNALTGGQFFWGHEYRKSLTSRVKSILENQGLAFTEALNKELTDMILSHLPNKSSGNVWTVRTSHLTIDEIASEHVNVSSCLWGMYERYRPNMIANGLQSLRVYDEGDNLRYRAWVIEGDNGFALFDLYHVNGAIRDGGDDYRQILQFARYFDLKTLFGSHSPVMLGHDNDRLNRGNAIMYCDTVRLAFFAKQNGTISIEIPADADYPTMFELVGRK